MSQWKLYLDGSSNKNRSSAELILISPENYQINSSLRFSFKASNNKDEHKALIAELRITKELQGGTISLFNDSKLLV